MEYEDFVAGTKLGIAGAVTIRQGPREIGGDDLELLFRRNFAPNHDVVLIRIWAQLIKAAQHVAQMQFGLVFESSGPEDIARQRYRVLQRRSNEWYAQFVAVRQQHFAADLGGKIDVLHLMETGRQDPLHLRQL